MLCNLGSAFTADNLCLNWFFAINAMKAVNAKANFVVNSFIRKYFYLLTHLPGALNLGQKKSTVYECNGKFFNFFIYLKNSN